jgi:hypothetical protein
MLQLAFDVAQWVVYVAGGIAVAALLVVVWRLTVRKRFPIGSVVVLIIAGAVCVASVQFLRTRVQQITLGTITQLGLESHHAGLRTDAVIYDTPVSVTASWKPLPSEIPGSGLINSGAGALVHKTMTVDAKVAVYGLIDFTTVAHETAMVNRQTRTITLALPDPAVDQDTVYIWSVAGVQERTGVLTAIGQSLIGPFESLFHHSQLSFNMAPELTAAEAGALGKAKASAVLSSCGKQEIAQQLSAAFALTPAYAGYTVHVTWPDPPAAGVNCGAMQRQLASAGS